MANEQEVRTHQHAAAKDAAQEMAKSMAEQEVNRVVHQAMPNELQQLSTSGLRSIPVLGTVLQWFDNISWIRNLFGGRR